MKSEVVATPSSGHDSETQNIAQVKKGVGPFEVRRPHAAHHGDGEQSSRDQRQPQPGAHTPAQRCGYRGEEKEENRKVRDGVVCSAGDCDEQDESGGIHAIVQGVRGRHAAAAQNQRVRHARVGDVRHNDRHDDRVGLNVLPRFDRCHHLSTVRSIQR